MRRYELEEGEASLLRAKMAQEMRRDVGIRSAFIAYAEARVIELQLALIPPLLNERESDMLRGKIAELKNIINEVQSTGEEHGLE